MREGASEVVLQYRTRWAPPPEAHGPRATLPTATPAQDLELECSRGRKQSWGLHCLWGLPAARGLLEGRSLEGFSVPPWAEGLAQPRAVCARKCSQATSQVQGPSFLARLLPYTVQAADPAPTPAPVVPSRVQAPAQHGRCGSWDGRPRQAPLATSGATSGWGGGHSHAGVPSAGRASKSPGRRAANTIHPAGASSHTSPACPRTRGRAQSRGCWARGKYSHTTVVTDFLYKQPEGSFLTLLSSCPVREGVWRKGRLELPGTEPGPGLGEDSWASVS